MLTIEKENYSEGYQRQSVRFQELAGACIFRRESSPSGLRSREQGDAIFPGSISASRQSSSSEVSARSSSGLICVEFSARARQLGEVRDEEAI